MQCIIKSYPFDYFIPTFFKGWVTDNNNSDPPLCLFGPMRKIMFKVSRFLMFG